MLGKTNASGGGGLNIIYSGLIRPADEQSISISGISKEPKVIELFAKDKVTLSASGRHYILAIIYNSDVKATIIAPPDKYSDANYSNRFTTSYVNGTLSIDCETIGGKNIYFDTAHDFNIYIYG